MWRSTRVGAKDNKMCMEKILCTPTFYSLLLWPKCFSISISNDPYILIILLSPALTSVLPYMHESSHMCSDILLSPAPTPVLLLIYQQFSMYSNHSTISCSNCISSPHARAMSCVLWHFILSCSDSSASAHLSIMSHVLQYNFILLLQPQCFSTCMSHVLCALTFYSLLLWSQYFSVSILNDPCTPII